jgi:hypothetical protein
MQEDTHLLCNYIIVYGDRNCERTEDPEECAIALRSGKLYALRLFLLKLRTYATCIILSNR